VSEVPLTQLSYSRLHGSTISIESSDGSCIFHCTSGALDGLDNKDTLCATLRRAGLSFVAPPSTLIEWDAVVEELSDATFPRCIGGDGDGTVSHEKRTFVLKSALGSQGQGIYFVSTLSEVMRELTIQADNARKYVGLLEEVRGRYGRLPAWVLQSEVPSLLVRGGRKCHIRSYVLVVERGSSLDMYIYRKHEVRVAAMRYDASSYSDRGSHITNGAGKELTERCLTEDIAELNGIEEELEQYVVQMFESVRQEMICSIAEARRSDCEREELENKQLSANASTYGHCKSVKFAFAGVDIMVDNSWKLRSKEYLQDKKEKWNNFRSVRDKKGNHDSAVENLGLQLEGPFWMLELNRNPAAPPSHVISSKFHDHLMEVSRGAVKITMGNDDGCTGFKSFQSVLDTSYC
jgi:hypothetical protein